MQKIMSICDLISESNVAKTDIKKLIFKTFYTNRKENYGNICQHGNSISIENVGVGEKEHIPPEKMRYSGCSGRAKKLAEIHTHPGRNLFLSQGDILDSFRRNIDNVCIAVESEFKDNRIRCYNIKDEYKEKRKYIDNLKREIEDIIPKIREADDKAFKVSYSKDEKLRADVFRTKRELKEKYWSIKNKLDSELENTLNFFDYCDLFL